MTPRFSAAVDPIFLQALGLLERIGRKESVSFKDERMRLIHCFDNANGLLGSSPDWELAKYALACWIDEVLNDVEWAHRRDWREQVLEYEFFSTRDRYWKFYVNAEEALRLPNRDALETYYVCVVLGFQGLYRAPQNPDEESQRQACIQEKHLPPDRETWARQRAQAIQIGKGRPAILENAEAIPGAPPLNDPGAVVWPCLAGLMLVAAGVIAGYLFAIPLPWR